MKKFVIAVVVFGALALTAGGAVAAGRWVISSTHQIKPSVLKQLHGAQGSRGYSGAKGAAGAQGGQGVQGVPGVETVSTVNGADAFMAPQGIGDSVATCPSGTLLTGGGYSSVSDPLVQGAVAYDYAYGNSWVIIASDQSSVDADVYATAQCVGGGGTASQARVRTSGPSPSSLMATLKSREAAAR